MKLSRTLLLAILFALISPVMADSTDETTNTDEPETGFWKQTLESWKDFLGFEGELDSEASDADNWIIMFNQLCADNENCESDLEAADLEGEGQGIGLMARKLGYQPGSEQFRLLKKVLQDGDKEALAALMDGTASAEKGNRGKKGQQLAAKENKPGNSSGKGSGNSGKNK